MPETLKPAWQLVAFRDFGIGEHRENVDQGDCRRGMIGDGQPWESDRP